MGGRSRSEIDLAESIARPRNQDDPSRPAPDSLAQTNGVLHRHDYRKCSCVRDNPNRDDGSRARARGSTGRIRLESFEPWSLRRPETMGPLGGIVRGRSAGTRDTVYTGIIDLSRRFATAYRDPDS